MQIHQVKRKNINKKKRQVGRGGTRGKTSGHGMKGQKSRAGKSIRPEIRDVIKKLPKKRGYRFSSIQIKPTVINLSSLEKVYENGNEVNPTSLLKKGLIKMKKGKLPKIKILGTGDFTKKVIVSKCQVSKTAEDKIKKAKGSVKEQ